VAGLRLGSVTRHGGPAWREVSNHSRGAAAVILAVIPPETTRKRGSDQADGTADLISKNGTLCDGVDGCGSTSNP